MRVPDQPGAVLRVALEVESGRLALTAGSESLGEWALANAEVQFDQDGVILVVDGEELFVVLSDREGFARAVEGRTREPGGRGFRLLPWRRPRAGPVERREAAVVTAPRPVREEPGAGPSTSSPTPPTRSVALTPQWKWGAVAGVGVVVLAVVAPSVLTALLMVTGGILVLAGVLGASDEYIASRLPSVLSLGMLLGWGVAAIVASLLVAMVT